MKKVISEQEVRRDLRRRSDEILMRTLRTPKPSPLQPVAAPRTPKTLSRKGSDWWSTK